MLDPESIAVDLLRRARLDTGEPVPPRAIAYALGIELVVARTHGTHDTTLARTIIYDGTTRALVHALAHVACVYAGLPTPHDERLVAAVGARLLTPATAVRRAVRAGSQRQQLAAAFGVSQTCAALRRGEVTGEPVAIVTPSTIYARGDWQWPAADVLRRMLSQRSRLIRWAPLGDDRRRMIVVPR